jgi:hypothetical protein
MTRRPQTIAQDPDQALRPGLPGKLALALASSALLLLLLAGLEWVLRRVDPQYLARTRGFFVHSRVYGWAGRPHTRLPMGSGTLTLDGRGYRGPRLPQPAAPGPARVVVLGDSIASGYGVADHETFPHQLHERDNGIHVENLAVEGYGPGQELLVLEREGLRPQPDLVLLAMCLRNDFVDSGMPVALYDGVTPRPVFRLEGERLVLDDAAVRRSPPGRAVQWLSDHSHLFNRLAASLRRRSLEQERSWRHRKKEALQDEEYAFRLTLALVLEMDRLCRARDIRFAVATFPNGVSYEMRPRMHRRLHEALAAAGVPVVEMGERFRERGVTAEALTLDDVGHLAPEGHRVSAEILERELAAIVRDR